MRQPVNDIKASGYRYPGVTPFSVEQADIFFGREQDIKGLYRLPEKDQLPARRLIEEGLVAEGEAMRLSLHESYIVQEFGVSEQLLGTLVESRLLRSEPFLRGGYTYEVSHDRLVLV